MQRLLSWIFAIVAASGLLLAQSTTGTITGIVTDASGAVVPDATVSVRNTTMEQKRQELTTSS